jgi:hypothetical protein
MSLRFVLPAFALLLPILARADGNPDFERDAKPILNRQPGLVQYVNAHYLVQETGLAKFPGTADHPPGPPFIFNAKPRGASGPFYLRLLIQPGPAGHILKVADVRKLKNGAPPQENASAVASGPVEQPAAPAQPAPSQTPAPAANQPISSSPPGSDVPSGPIPDSGSTPSSSGSSSSLTPPPDPAPATQ